jgi:hypothetical protein
MIVRRLAHALIAVALLLTACRKAEIATYRIPKEKDPELPPATATASTDAPPAARGANMAATAVPTASGPALTWTAPAHWKAKAASAMRKGSYAVPGNGGVEADLSITSFGGDVGGELANLNRWRGQLQLPPVSEAELATAVTRLEHNGLHFGFVDLGPAGANKQRILGAWAAHAGATWFFKLGPAPDALVTKEKQPFLDFLATVKATTP